MANVARVNWTPSQHLHAPPFSPPQGPSHTYQVCFDGDVLAINLGLQLHNVGKVGRQHMRFPLFVRVQRDVLLDLPLQTLQLHALGLLRDMVHLDGRGNPHFCALL